MIGFIGGVHPLCINQVGNLGGFPNLFIAGADFAGNGMGYIDGAVKTGQQAAKNIIRAIDLDRRQNSKSIASRANT